MTQSVFTDEYQFFRELLIKARKNANLSQRKLSAKLGMSSSFVGKYELGERRLDVIELIWILQVLKVDSCNFIRKLESFIHQSEQHHE